MPKKFQESSALAEISKQLKEASGLPKKAHSTTVTHEDRHDMQRPKLERTHEVCTTERLDDASLLRDEVSLNEKFHDWHVSEMAKLFSEELSTAAEGGTPSAVLLQVMGTGASLYSDIEKELVLLHFDKEEKCEI